ncbi:MAG: hypothetical protein HY225_01490 [Candidatus Vogelbacteria bacterium]|nr:hypothetical protein [Candidatus Vogelbacteria bacterium]
MNIDLKYFKEKLEAEKIKIEDELKSMSIKNPRNQSDWQATYPERDLQDKIEADPTDVADNIEDYQERYALNDVLENRLNSVREALRAIEVGSYGICKIGGREHSIENERLEANPAAATCINHIEG